MSPFATGDVVRLKSGGPNMLVVRCDDSGVYCIWAAHPEGEPDNPHIKSHAFPSDALTFVLGANGGAT